MRLGLRDGIIILSLVHQKWYNIMSETLNNLGRGLICNHSSSQDPELCSSREFSGRDTHRPGTCSEIFTTQSLGTMFVPRFWDTVSRDNADSSQDFSGHKVLGPCSSRDFRDTESLSITHPEIFEEQKFKKNKNVIFAETSKKQVFEILIPQLSWDREGSKRKKTISSSKEQSSNLVESPLHKTPKSCRM